MTAKEKFEEMISNEDLITIYKKLEKDTRQDIVSDWIKEQNTEDLAFEVLGEPTLEDDWHSNQLDELSNKLISDFKDYLSDDKSNWENDHLAEPFEDDVEPDDEEVKADEDEGKDD